MIHHCVFLNFDPTCGRSERDEKLLGFASIVDEVPGMLSYIAGPNADFESKSEAYSDGFVATFTDRDAMLAYDANARHVEFGQWLVANCVGGHRGIIVFDIVT